MSKASVIWTTAALDDLLDIEDFIGVPSKAEAVIDRIIARAKQLENFPESGRKLSTQAKQQYRYLVEGNYKIIYSYRQTTVYIHTVFDTRRDPGELKV